MSDTPKGYHGHKTLKDGTRVSLTKDEADSLWSELALERRERAERFPTVMDALDEVSIAMARMQNLGWRKSGMLIRAGDHCAVCEFGSTGIFSGIMDADREYVMFGGGYVSKPNKLWLKPIAELTPEERAHMNACDKEQREYMEGEFDRWSSQEKGDTKRDSALQDLAEFDQESGLLDGDTK